MQIVPHKFYAAASAASTTVKGPFDTLAQAQAFKGLKPYAGAELTAVAGAKPSLDPFKA